MNSWISKGAVFLVGLLVGVAVIPVVHVYLHRDTVMFTTTEDVTAEGILIPEGTELAHDESMSEGYDRLVLYINVDPDVLERSFSRRVDDRPFLVVPYQAQRSPR